MGTTAAANATLSRRGMPRPLSRFGSMPDTAHSPPANAHVIGGMSPTIHAATPYPAPIIVDPVMCTRNPGTKHPPLPMKQSNATNTHNNQTQTQSAQNPSSFAFCAQEKPPLIRTQGWNRDYSLSLVGRHTLRASAETSPPPLHRQNVKVSCVRSSVPRHY